MIGRQLSLTGAGCQQARLSETPAGCVTRTAPQVGLEEAGGRLEKAKDAFREQVWLRAA